MIGFKEFINEGVIIHAKTPYELIVSYPGNITKYKYFFSSQQAVDDAYKKRRNIAHFKDYVKNLDFQKL